MAYDVTTVPKFKIKPGTLGPIDIVDEHNAFVLYNNGDQWMVFNKANHDEIKEMYSSYDIAYGDVLVSGLGFGILALWLCSKPEVTSVTVVEISQEVIDLFKAVNNVPEKLNIVNHSILEYQSDREYDCLLLDHYERQTVQWRLKNMQDICSKIKHKNFWAWSLEQVYVMKMFNFNLTDFLNVSDSETKFNGKFDSSVSWIDFATKYLPSANGILNIPLKTVNEYVYTYFNKHHLLGEQ